MLIWDFPVIGFGRGKSRAAFGAAVFAGAEVVTASYAFSLTTFTRPRSP